jgi:hypothetical protein
LTKSILLDRAGFTIELSAGALGGMIANLLSLFATNTKSGVEFIY